MVGTDRCNLVRGAISYHKVAVGCRVQLAACIHTYLKLKLFRNTKKAKIVDESPSHLNDKLRDLN